MKYRALAGVPMHRCISTTRVKLYIQQLKTQCASSNDGVLAEHLLYSMDTELLQHIANMLSICIKFGVVPQTFREGILVPIPKKSAFDAIPHSIIFHKAADVLPDQCWRLLLTWYKDMCVRIKWENRLSDTINIEIGTRQGGLSSPFLFNIFYHDLIDTLSQSTEGININGETYNVFCYADDIMLASMTPRGLQSLIDISSEYIKSHGLNFNPSKTVCCTFGKCHFRYQPTWKLNDVTLESSDRVTYLGTTMSNDPSDHVDTRIRGARQAFYGLQSAGVCKDGVSPYTAAHIYNTAIRPILKFGCCTLPLIKTHVKELEQLQCLLLKTSLGLSKYSRNTSLRTALRVTPIENTIASEQLSLLKSALIGSSKARTFYSSMMNKNNQFNMEKHNGLLFRVNDVCKNNNISLLKYICSDRYAIQCKGQLLHIPQTGTSDSLSYLLQNYNQQSKELVKLIVRSF